MTEEEKTGTVKSGEITEVIYEGWIDPEIELPEEKVVVLVVLEDSLALGYVEDGEWNISHFPSECNWNMEMYCWLPLPSPFEAYQFIPDP